MPKSSEIRQQFLDFFCQKHGHAFVPSSPVVPLDDPTLLFTNAGMNQFKPLFLGQEKRGYTRAANTQKCIRAGGKHNDLDDVGRSRRHHTFFEMLGNWSFGDYFKAEAIAWAWELLTEVWKLDPTRLHVSCFEGDEKNGVPRDTEAAELWKSICGISDDRIHYFGKDNFWEMGDTGPCGPCTEIYIDRTPGKTGGKDVNGEDPRVMEIWNLVFIQYNRNADRSLTPLPARHVDTGMGFERISQVLQNVDDNFAIDLWTPFFQKLSDLSGREYAGKFPKTNSPDPAAEAADPQLRTDIAFRVIADHIRCLTFALTDGAVPSNEGRGYVLRRILRRAYQFGWQHLEFRDPFLFSMVPAVVDAMGHAFPELSSAVGRVSDAIRAEEEAFSRTIARGFELVWSQAALTFRAQLDREQEAVPENERLSAFIGGAWISNAEESQRYLQREVVDGVIAGVASRNIQIFTGADRTRAPTEAIPIQKLDAAFVQRYLRERPMLSGEAAFRLHATDGFPIDLTQIVAAERGMSVDIAGYERLMQRHVEISRAGGKDADSPVYTLTAAAIAELQKQGVGPTDDSAKFSTDSTTARVKAIWNGSNLDPLADTSEDQEVAVLLDRTSFYAEMGGQVGDQGQLASTEGNFDVETTRAVGGYVLHIGRVAIGRLSVGDPVTAVVHERTRWPTMQNHTATHLLNWALREVLGDAVQQKGSLVDPDKLRFDFSHHAALKDDDLARAEALVADGVLRDWPVYAEEAPQEQALKINGLRAVFGEKYPPRVRVVSIGAAVGDLLKDPADPAWRQHSIEFCGGTHVRRTGEIGRFVITAEESVSKGVRRLVALTGERASAAIASAERLMAEVERVRGWPQAELPQTLAALQKRAGAEGVPLSARRGVAAAVAELQERQKKWEKAQRAGNSATVDVSAEAVRLLASGEARGGGLVIVGEVPGASDDQLRGVLDSLRNREPKVAALVGATDGVKVSFVGVVSDELIARGLKAGDWVREAAKAAGGGGGGRPQMAQAGGKDPAKLAEALDAARTYASKTLT